MNSDRSSDNDWLPNLSRRDFFHTTGLSAGSMILPGVSKWMGLRMPEAEAAIRKGETVLNFSLELEDGSARGPKPVGILKSVEGGIHSLR